MSTNTDVLVTGAAGYIGSQTCKQLKLKGYNVVGIDTNEPINSSYMDKFLLIDVSDIRSYYVLTKYKIKNVIHTAATSLVGPSVNNPETYYHNNVMRLQTFLRYCKQAEISRFVFSSSAAVYGNQYDEIWENALTPDPINPYGRTKLTGEFLIRDYATAYDFSAIALRYFNVAGADPDQEFGQVGQPTHIIGAAITKYLDGQELIINGNDYDTFDGTCIRDYVHVCDVADANIEALTAQIDQPFQAMNISTGTGLSNKQIAETLQKYIDIKYSYGPRRDGDPALLIGNSEKATRLLNNWTPKLSSIDSIIESAVKWHEKDYQLNN